MSSKDTIKAREAILRLAGEDQDGMITASDADFVIAYSPDWIKRAVAGGIDSQCGNLHAVCVWKELRKTADVIKAINIAAAERQAL